MESLVLCAILAVLTMTDQPPVTNEEVTVEAPVEADALASSVMVENAARLEAARAAREARAEAKAEEKEAKAERLEDLRRIDSRIFKLEHASATEVAEQFNAMWSGDFGTNWKITKMAVAFPESNTLMVTAPRGIIAACEQAIRGLDVEAQQVYIEARFVELGNRASHKVGIDWSGIAGGTTISGTVGAGFQATQLGDGVTSYSRHRVGSNGKDTDDYSLAARTTAATVDALGNVTGFTEKGGSDGTVAYFNGTLNVSQMALTLSALDASSDAKTFSNPKIIVSSGKMAKVDMTTKYPNVKIATKRTTGTSDSVDIASSLESIPGEDKFMFAKEAFFSWGISLEVTPRISTNGLISVKIVPTISSNDGWVQTGTTDLSTDVSGTISTKYPIIRVQRLISEFNLASGTTAVIGGLSITEEKQVDNGIPVLREIPWIGTRLFGSMERVKEQKEIIVFVTVGLVDPHNIREDAGLPKNAVLGRQYTNGQKLEPGDRPAKNMEGFDSLDLRELEDQAKDPLRKQKETSFFDGWIPFQKDPDYSSKEGK